MHHSTYRIAHTTDFVTPVVEHWLEREIAQWVHHMKDRSDDPSHHERTPLPRSYISLPGRLDFPFERRKEGMDECLTTPPAQNINRLVGVSQMVGRKCVI